MEKMFYKFLWNSGPDTIKRSIAIKALLAGRLRMVNIQVFIKAPRITWLRRVIQNHENMSWYALSGIDFSESFFFPWD